MKRIIALVLCIVMAFSVTACGKTVPTKDEISQLVGDAIISDNAGSYYEGECSAEGHKILGSSLSGNRLKVYTLTMYGNYGFQNDMFVKVSGSGVIPAVLTFEKNGEEYILLEIEYPLDGAGYIKSIKRMFPLKYRTAALHCDNAQGELKAQERNYAEEYLQSIGRDAEIGEYRDLNAVLLTDLGISVEVSNQLSCDKSLGDYPFWIGTSEYLENGVRYVRSLSYDEDAGLIIYSTVEKETGEVTECFVFDASTGEPRSAGPAVSQMEPAGLTTSNPWSDWNSVIEAENAAGFAFGLPETIEGSYIAESYRTMSGETPIIEATYADEDWTVVVRKAPGEGQDISGIYDHNDVQTGERHGEKITYYRQHDSESGSLKIVISNDGYSWSIYAPNGFWGGSWDGFMISIFEQ